MFQPFNPFTIPVVFLIGAFAVGIVAMILSARAKSNRHRERMFLAEKGLPIPSELYEVQKQEVKSDGYKAGRAWLIILGILAMFIGISVMIMLGIRDGNMHDAVGGLVPIFIGAAFLVSERMIARYIVRRSE
jgi:amino acid transporter